MLKKKDIIDLNEIRIIELFSKNNKMGKKILFILIFIYFAFSFYSCKRIEINVNYSYLKQQDNNPDSLFIDKTPKDSILMFFNCGFNSDRVKVLINGNKIYNNVITSNPSLCMADQCYFRKQKENKIQLLINGRRTKEILLDIKFNYVTLDWYHNENKLYLTYSDHSQLFD